MKKPKKPKKRLSAKMQNAAPTREARETTERELVAPRTGEGAAVGWALRAVLTRFGEVEREMARRLSLSTTDVSALEHLMREPTLGPVELAHRLGMTSASATVLVDRLERVGHVSRKPHAHDRRRRVLYVTPQAQARLFEALTPLLNALSSCDKSFSDKEQALIERYLRGVVEVYDRFLEHT